MHVVYVCTHIYVASMSMGATGRQVGNLESEILMNSQYFSIHGDFQILITSCIS